LSAFFSSGIIKLFVVSCDGGTFLVVVVGGVFASLTLLESFSLCGVHR
jgi:hypothetical protein